MCCALVLATVGGCASRAVIENAATPGRETPLSFTQAPTSFVDATAAMMLVHAVDERLAAMRVVAAAKWTSGAPIEDPEREAAVLDSVARRATTLGLDADGVRALFTQQIRLARHVQQALQDEWRRERSCAPCRERPSLTDARVRIDEANERQLRALYLTVPATLDATATSALVAGLEALRTKHGFEQQAIDDLRATMLAIRRAPTPDGTWERIRSTGLLRIGTTGDYAPFSVETPRGDLAGADVDLALELAGALQVAPVFLRTSWPTLLEDLRSGKFDVALSGISHTPQRAEFGEFSEPYYEGGKTFATRCADQSEYDTLAEVNRPGVRAIVNPGGTNERYAREHLGQATIVVHPDNRTVFEEILAGRADVMITDDVEVELQALRHPGRLCRPSRDVVMRSDKRVLMQRDPELVAAVEAWLAGSIAAGQPAAVLRHAMETQARTPSKR